MRPESAHDTDGLAAHLVPAEGDGAHFLEALGLLDILCLVHVPHQAQRHGKSELRNGKRVGAGGIDDRDAELLTRGHVQDIHPNAVPGDDLALLGPRDLLAVQVVRAEQNAVQLLDMVKIIHDLRELAQLFHGVWVYDLGHVHLIAHLTTPSLSFLLTDRQP